jgi:Holliday junction resolvase
MGKESRDKGYRGEHNLVNMFKSEDINAVRVPLSGATEFAKGDIILDNNLRCEVKVRKSGFKQIYDWLEDKDLLFVKSDRQEYLCIMPISVFIKLFKGRDDR